MIRRTRRAILLSALAFTSLVAVGGQAWANAPQRVVDKARLTVEAFLDDPKMADMRVYVQNAYGILIVPELLKGGFFIGAEHGMGVLLVRDPQSGSWSEPAFYEIYGGSFGLQFGGQTSEAVFTLMNPGAIQKLLSSNFKLGADASVALGEIGARVGAGTTVQLGEDVYVFARNKGLYGGLALDGTYTKPKDAWNQAYYGRPLTAEQIVLQRAVAGLPATQQLRTALSRF